MHKVAGFTLIAAISIACGRHGDSQEAASPAVSATTSAIASSIPATSTAPKPLASASTSAPSPAAAPSNASGPAPDLNVILISIDSLRADMPWAGYARPIAPNLTTLEKRAVTFTHAYSVSSYTSMSLGGLLGGKLPSELKRDGYFFSVYPKENLFFPELLQSAHIHTLGAQAHGYFKDAGFRQGFDAWEVVPNLKWSQTTDENVTGPQQEALAEKLLGEDAVNNGRFFGWFHFMDPHDQYQPHEKDGIPAYGKTLRDRYDAEVTFCDRQIGKLLDFIAAHPWGKRTAIIVTADHGEAFGEHKQYGHGFEVWENLVHVPLFFVLPGVAPRHIDENRSALDLAPTILALFGVPPESTFEGVNLVPEIYGAKSESRDVIVDLPATSDNDKRRALIHGTLKIVASGAQNYLTMYDLEKDPDEKSPINKGDSFTEMAARYHAYAKTVKDVPAFGCKENCLNGAYRNVDAGH